MQINKCVFVVGIAVCSVGQIMATPSPTLAQHDAGRASISAQVERIRKQYDDINAGASGYRKKERDLSGFSAEGGTLTGYYRANELKKIVATYYGESGRTINEFYFENGALIFALSTDIRYAGSLNDAAKGSSGIASLDKDRFYFDQGILLRWLSPGGKIESTQDKAGREKEKKWKAEVADLRKRLSRSISP